MSFIVLENFINNFGRGQTKWENKKDDYPVDEVNFGSFNKNDESKRIVWSFVWKV